jgi:hypothetical protein
MLRVVEQNREACNINAARSLDTIAFRGDAVDAPVLCCGNCTAPLATGVDRITLTNMQIECRRCGSFNDTREFGINQS